MRTTYHPLQKLCYINQSSEVNLLLVANGPYILSLDLKNGGVNSKWPDDTTHFSPAHHSEAPLAGAGALGGTDKEDNPPNKRRKLSPSQHEEQNSCDSSVSIEFVSERAKGQRRKKKNVSKSTLPNVSHLICTADGLHIIAVTAEDKCIRVFELNALGSLRPLSERCMPKRLCALALTKDQCTVLAGDKFGDVYALPLHPSFEPSAVPPMKYEPDTPKPYKPSASELTVHTKGNREALRQQQLQKDSALKRKLELTFEHRLILGHVSLLTDLVVCVDASNDRREYILTSDRDEHIRVSRGIPQAHVINNYCVSHTDFVSKLCIVPERPKYLISGGGEPSLRIYDWLQGTVVAEAHLEEHLEQLVSKTFFNDVAGFSEKRAVSCIRALYLEGDVNRDQVIMIIAALEGTPGISTFHFYPSTGFLKQERQYVLDANVLDIVLIKDSGLMLVSLDSVHSPLSMRTPVSQAISPILRVFSLRVVQSPGDWCCEWVAYDPAKEKGESVPTASSKDIASKLERTLQSGDVRHEIEVDEVVKPKGLYSPLGEFLYGLENLRKKPQGNGEVQQGEELAVINPEEG